jgi:G:T-mismatch repair DNA endonuclease (very short patch repair protein)
MTGDTLAQRYENTVARLEQITRAGYKVEVHWECEFEEGILVNHPELKTPHCTTQSSEHSRCSVVVEWWRCGCIVCYNRSRPFST